MLEAGTKAPVFSLPDKDGNMISLEDYRGKRVVLYFYPRDNTPGCTREACAFAGAYEGFKQKDVVVIEMCIRDSCIDMCYSLRTAMPWASIFWRIASIFASVWAITSAHCFNSWLISLSSRRDFLYLS